MLKNQNHPVSTADPARAALWESLAVLDSETRESVLLQLRTRYRISLLGTEPIPREEIHYALRQLLGDGCTLFMSSFDKKYEAVRNGRTGRLPRPHSKTIASES